MPRLLLVVTLALLTAATGAPEAQAQLAEGSARTLAMGRAGTALRAEPWGRRNPATWSTVEARTAEAFASQAFGLSELRVVGVAAALPTAYGSFAANAQSYGYTDYRETTIGVGYARSVPLSSARRLHLGATVQYHAVSIPGFSAGSTIGVSVGALVNVAPGLDAGLEGRNLNRIGAEGLDAPLTTAPALSVGLAYRPSEQALILLDAEKDLDGFPLVVRGGVEIRPVDVLAVRVGVSASDPVRVSGGLGIRYDRFEADLAVEQHETLGITPALSLRARL